MVCFATVCPFYDTPVLFHPGRKALGSSAEYAFQLPLGNSSVELFIADGAVLLEDKLEVAACIARHLLPSLGILAQRRLLTTLAEQESVFVPVVATCAAAVDEIAH
jgi:hypothetical protein